MQPSMARLPRGARTRTPVPSWQHTPQNWVMPPSPVSPSPSTPRRGERGAGASSPSAGQDPGTDSDTTEGTAVPTKGVPAPWMMVGTDSLRRLCPCLASGGGMRWVSLGKLRHIEHATPPSRPQGATCPAQGTGGDRQTLVASGRSREQPLPACTGASSCPRVQVGPREGGGRWRSTGGCARVRICGAGAVRPWPRPWLTRSAAGWGPRAHWEWRVLCWGWGGPMEDGAAAAGQCKGFSCTGLRHSHDGLNWDGVLGLTGVLHAMLVARHTGWDGGTAYWGGLGARCAGLAGGTVSRWAGGYPILGWTGSTPTLDWEP